MTITDAIVTNFCMNKFYYDLTEIPYVVLLVPLSSINKRGTNDVMNKHVSFHKMLLCIVYHGNKFYFVAHVVCCWSRFMSGGQL